jgi:hypothetical protein
VQELRAWLTRLHIDGWRREFDATEYEVADLLEYVRRRGSGLVNDLLERGRATVHVTTGEAVALSRLPVSVNRALTSAKLLVVHQGRPVAEIPADCHVDVMALIDSGLETQFILEGTQMSITTTPGPSSRTYGDAPWTP